MDHVINCFNSWRKGEILKCHVSAGEREREKYLRALNSLKSLNTTIISYPHSGDVSTENFFIKNPSSRNCFLASVVLRSAVRQLLNLMMSKEVSVRVMKLLCVRSAQEFWLSWWASAQRRLSVGRLCVVITVSLVIGLTFHHNTVAIVSTISIALLRLPCCDAISTFTAAKLMMLVEDADILTPDYWSADCFEARRVFAWIFIQLNLAESWIK